MQSGHERRGVCFYCGAVATPTGSTGTSTDAPPGTPPPDAQRPAGPATPPLPSSAAGLETIPETRRYRLKNKLLGPPLVTEQLATERLRKPIALGVLAPDCISSSAYGTE